MAGQVGPVVVLHRVRRRPRGPAGRTKLSVWQDLYCETFTQSQNSHDHILSVFLPPAPNEVFVIRRCQPHPLRLHIIPQSKTYSSNWNGLNFSSKRGPKMNVQPHLLLLLQATFPLGPEPRQAAARAAQAEQLCESPGGGDDGDVVGGDDDDDVVDDDVHLVVCWETYETQCCSKRRSPGSCLS